MEQRAPGDRGAFLATSPNPEIHSMNRLLARFAMVPLLSLVFR